MTETVIARRYAKALLDVARGKDEIAAVNDHLALLAEAVGRNDEIRRFLANPRIPPAHKLDALTAALEKQGAPRTVRAFASVLCQAKRASLLQAMAREFSRMADEARGILAVRVASAAPVEESALQEIRAKLEAAAGKRVRLESTVDEELLGGVALRIGNQVIDASLRSRLEQVRRALR